MNNHTVAIASGKGGTGKTTLAVNLAYALFQTKHRVRLLDCDVEAPNAHLFLNRRFAEISDITVRKPRWDENQCIVCKKCAESCNYNAIAITGDKVLIFDELCHACGVCSYVCPSNALVEQPVSIGKIRVASEPSEFIFVDGYLDTGEVLAPVAVDAVKAYAGSDSINILDAAPGTGCAVVKTITGADVTVLVTEPTPFGLHDLTLAVAMTLNMGIPTGIVINRSDGTDAAICEYAERVGVPVIGRIPFDRKYAEAYSAGEILAERFSEIGENLLEIYGRVQALTKMAVPEPPIVEKPCVSLRDSHAGAGAAPSGQRPEIGIISGKGGTGKTTIAASFAALSNTGTISDTDVDAADLHLLLAPRIIEAHQFTGSTVARIEQKSCTHCGQCEQVCRFGAIYRAEGSWHIDPILCEGCGFCGVVCPDEAIFNEEVVSGDWYVSSTEYGTMVHAAQRIGEENSGRLVSHLRGIASSTAAREESPQILADGPPGTGCPVIASITGLDLAVIVTEPTVAGVHDLDRILDLTFHFKVPACIIINKVDLNPDQASRIQRHAASRKVPVIGYIPFDQEVMKALQAQKIVVKWSGSKAADAIIKSWKEVQNICRNGTYIIPTGGRKNESSG